MNLSRDFDDVALASQAVVGRCVKTALLASLYVAVLAGCIDTTDSSMQKPATYAGAADIGSFCDRLPRAAYADLKKHKTSNDWFEVYEIEPGIWAIYEPFQWQEVISYLIAGSEAAVLFDTGNGIGDIKAIVDQLTDRPVRVINSHSHFDHIGGNYQFDQILSVSTPFTLQRTSGIRSEELLIEVSPAALCKSLPAGVVQDDHHTRAFSITQTIADGDTIDVGGRLLEVLRVPGHTDDSIALLDRNAGYLWSGDSFYEGPIWLFFPETDLVAYRESVAKLAALAPNLKAVFPAHNTPKADPALLLGLRDNLDQVLAGEVEPVPVSDGNVEFRFDGFGLLMREDYYRIPAEQP